jgi:hypothetical protein
MNTVYSLRIRVSSALKRTRAPESARPYSNSARVNSAHFSIINIYVCVITIYCNYGNSDSFRTSSRLAFLIGRIASKDNWLRISLYFWIVVGLTVNLNTFSVKEYILRESQDHQLLIDVINFKIGHLIAPN